MRNLIFAAVMLGSGAAHGQAPAVIDFRGVLLGASEADLTSKLSSAHCRVPPPQFLAMADRWCQVLGEDALNFGGVQATAIIADFLDDKLGHISVSIKPDQFSQVRVALIEKFGKPTSVETPEFATRGGLKTPNEIVTWKIGNGRVTAQRYSGSLDSASVEYTDDAWRGEVDRRLKERGKAGAKTL